MATKMCDHRKSEESPVPFEEALTMTGNGLYNILLMATCSLILLAIGMDLFGFSLVVTAACDLELTVTQKGILTSLPFIGILLVSYVWGYIADTKGRRFTLVVCLQIGFILSCVSSLSPNWLVLGIIKFLSVCFSCAANSATYTLVGESCTQRVRGKYMVLMTCFIILSPGIASVLAYPTITYLDFEVDFSALGLVFRPWRLLIIVLALPVGVGGFAIMFFHESPKFLANWGKQTEALEVLKSIYAINHHCDIKEFKVQSLTLEDSQGKKDRSLFRAMYEQCAPLFQPPLLWRTLQLFYITAVAYITNNSFLMWIPHILNLVRIAMEGAVRPSNVCSLISVSNDDHVETTTGIFNTSITSTMASITPDLCTGEIAKNVILTLITSQSIFAFLNLLISYLPNRRKSTLIFILCLASACGAGINLTPEPISSVIFFVGFTCTCLTMGILASYFVDLYPTSYRGMVACLSIMVGRSSAFIGINLVGNLIFHHCKTTFYVWSLLVFSSAIAAIFLPPDKTAVQNTRL